MSLKPKKDAPWVTTEGKSLQRMIDGVFVQPSVTQTDDRGSLCEISPIALKVNPAPLVHVYQFTIRPGKIKGWHVHYEHDDRIFLAMGEVKAVLYDDRPDSPTYKLVNEIFLTQHHRSVLIIPTRVFHAIQNIGTADAMFVSMPTKVYDHSNPDVYRFPIENDEIPYKFNTRIGH